MTRSYQMRARADAVEATRERILTATYELIFEVSYDDLTLRAVADRAGTTFQTVLRHFGSKDGLITATAERFAPAEMAARTPTAGDPASVAAVLCERYEATADATLRWEALEDRVEALGAAIRAARDGHRAWLEEVFADDLAGRARAERRLVLMELFAASDINTWRLWRRRLGLSPVEARKAMEGLLRAVVERPRS